LIIGTIALYKALKTKTKIFYPDNTDNLYIYQGRRFAVQVSSEKTYLNHIQMMRTLFFLTALAFVCNSFAQNTLPGCQMAKQNLIDFDRSSSPQTLADNLRSDTIDILKYTINLNITDFTTDTLRGNTFIQFVPKKNNIKTISLDLLHMQMDSIRIGTASLSYSFNDTLLIVQLPSTANIGDTSTIRIYYHGKPIIDASGWGGFYFQSGFAYNLGVGFAANPHNYGRVWYPCFDNFVERATYEFNISTNNGNVSYCNGVLKQDTTYTNGMRTRKWVMNQTIPSYLACVAVAPFVEISMTLPSLTGPKPVVIAAIPADTTNMKASFIHLPNAFGGFEKRYGPYRWDKVGYSLVPFSSGAMEHATNITYPKAFANGTTLYEAELMAHELSHHWFGDLATCRTEGDMWLNEGWATYSQFIFTENVYGYPAYLSLVEANHENVLHYANWKEGGYLPVSGVPHQYTYGDHVYLKGADVAHTLRTYMGDSLFFQGLRYHLAQSQYKDVSSTDFKNNLITSSGLTNLSDFFDNWVFNPGWPQFSVDSFAVTGTAPNFQVTVFIKQKLTGAPSFFNQVPLELSFKDSTWNSATKNITVSGQHSSFSFSLPFRPGYAGLNLNNKISQAVTSDNQILKTKTAVFSDQNRGRMTVTPTNASIATDSAWIRIEHNFTAADPFKRTGQAYLLSPNRYWRVDGLFPASFKASGLITYDGRVINSGGGGSLDNLFLNTTNLEDSIVLLYRSDRADDWHLEPNITKAIGIKTDKYGTIKINDLRKGEYVLALKGFTTSTQEIRSKELGAKVYPNPSFDRFNIELNGTVSGKEDLQVLVYDMSGRLCYSEKIRNERFSIGTDAWRNGTYLMTLLLDGKPAFRTKLVLAK
jgi:hypothetical protein